MAKTSNRDRVKSRIRPSVLGTESKPRLSVFKSNKEIYAQLINDSVGQTMVSASSKELKSRGKKVDMAKEVGLALGEKAKSSGVSELVFDRNGYVYHGRVKALADGAREAGLKF